MPEEERPEKCHAIEVDSDVNPGSSLPQIKPSGLLFFYTSFLFGYILLTANN